MGSVWQLRLPLPSGKKADGLGVSDFSGGGAYAGSLRLIPDSLAVDDSQLGSKLIPPISHRERTHCQHGQVTASVILGSVVGPAVRIPSEFLQKRQQPPPLC